MNLDLAKETQEIKDYILEQIKNQNEKVKLLEIGFQIDQGGLVKAYFDTDENAEPEGSWTMSLEENILERLHWPDLCEEIGYDEMASKIGDLLKTIIFEIKKTGGFDNMPKHSNCQFGVEEMNGCYCWPAYDDRDNENRV